MTTTSRRLVGGVFLILALAGSVYWAKHPSAAPRDVLGLSVGLDKADAQNHLQEIAEFQRAERNEQQVWKLKNDPHFSAVAIGYDRENKIRYVTAFADRSEAKEPIRFSSVGDLSVAKAEIMEPHYRYIWKVQPAAGQDAYTVNVYGDNPEFVTIYSIAKNLEPGQPGEEGEELD